MATAKIKPKDPSTGKMPAGFEGRAFVRWRTLLKFLDPLFKAVGLSADGLDVMETADGIHLRANAGSAVRHPFYVSIISGAGGSSDYVVEPGTFNGVVPTNLTGPVSVAAPIWVYLELTYSLSSTDSGYVYAAQLTSANIAAEFSAHSSPLGPKGSGEFYVLLATFDNGVKTGQHVTSSLSGDMCDSGNSDDTANLTVSAGA